MKALPLACVLFLTARAFAAEPGQLRPWTDYRTILWIGDRVYKKPEKLPLFFQRLREMGINTAMVHNDGDPRPLVEAKFSYYVENMVNKGLCLKWSSNVRDWDKHVTAWKDRRDEAGMVRDYCLDDPKWRAYARDEMQRIARKNMANDPVAYDIRDELSTTISANPFDYDFNPITLARFRDWLKTQYRDLAALNAGWETKFASWDDVKPFSTDQIKNRMAGGDAVPRGKPDWRALQAVKFDPIEARRNPTRWNISPWCDFRTYMDISLASALDDIRMASHRVDPRTPVGIEGTQMPGAFGGYDLWRLAQVLDWVEPYDIGNAREILGSFMPGKPVLTTVFEKDTNQARRRLWHLLLEGDRGCIVWWSEDCIDWESDDYALTPKAKALAPVLKEMTSPLGQLFLRAKAVYDPIAIHYSQSSVQVDWLLETAVDGSTWLRRFSSYEAEHNRMAKVRNGWHKAFQDLGYSPCYVSSEHIVRGALDRTAIFVMPQSYALSDQEAAAITGFVTRGHGPRALLVDGSPGCFDAHGRLRTSAALEQWIEPSRSEERVAFLIVNPASQPSRQGDAPRMSRFQGDVSAYPRVRMQNAPALALADAIQKEVPLPAREVTVPLESRTRVHRYTLGTARLVAFERNISYHMSEDLKQAGGNENLEKPVDLEARLDKPAHVYDLRAEKYLGHTDRITFTLDPWQPSLYALLPGKVPAERVLDILAAGAIPSKP